MKYVISEEIFKNNPGYIRGIIYLRDANNYGTDEELNDALKAQEDRVRSIFTIERLREESYIASWREAFQKFGSNPNKYPPSIENLIKRILKGHTLPYINKLVTIFNYISLKYVLPCGGDDLDRVEGDLLLTYAKGDELYIPLNESEPQPVVTGEVIYKDDRKVLCRKWTWRQGDATKILPESKDVIINVDGMPPAGEDDVKAAMSEMAALIKKYCGGDIVMDIISEHKNTYELL